MKKWSKPKGKNDLIPKGFELERLCGKTVLNLGGVELVMIESRTIDFMSKTF